MSVVMVSAGNALALPEVGSRYAVVYYGQMTEGVVRTIIERNYTIVIASSEARVPQALRERGVKVYAYMDILGLPVGMLKWVEENHPEWVLRRDDGEPAKFWFGSNFMCNIAVESFQEYLVEKAKGIVGRGFTGLFLDDVVADPRVLGPPLYDKPVYDEGRYGRWLDALTSFVRRLKSELNVSIIYNAGWAEPIPELMSVVDGVLLESHPGSWAGSLENPRYYMRDWAVIYRVSRAAQRYAEQGKIVVALSYGVSLEAQEYTFAAARLFDFYYWIATPDLGKILDYDVLKLDLGGALGGHQVESGVYYRLYEKGMVALNPSPQSREVCLRVPGGWAALYDLQGGRYEVRDGQLCLALKGESGKILLVAPASSGAGFDYTLLAYFVPAAAAAALVIAALLRGGRRGNGKGSRRALK